MSIVRCSNGHYYDDVKYAGCPHCHAGQFGGDSTYVGGEGYDLTQDEPTSAFVGQGNGKITVGDGDTEFFGSRIGDDRTVGYVESRLDMDPVVGWLVCTNGEERGRDYKLHAGRNFVGRSAGVDIGIYDDHGVSRENHCSVVYDPVHGDYLLAPGAGSTTYIHGALLRETIPLRDGDEIGIGGSTFVFIAFCKGERKWL